MRNENTINVQNMMLRNNIILSDREYDIINDIFEDNIINSVKVYTKKQLDDFKKDVVLKNIKNLDINGDHDGLVQWSSTLIGDIIYGAYELEQLTNGGEIISILNDLEYDTEMNENEIVVTVIEECLWNTKGIDETNEGVRIIKTLYIYVPQDGGDN